MLVSRLKIRSKAVPAALLVALCAGLPARAQEEQIPQGEELTDENVTEVDLEEVSRQLSNPVGSVWSLKLENNMTFLRGDPAHAYRGSWSTKFQPVMPLKLTENWNLIVRPVFEFLSTPTIDSSGDIDRTEGIGQTSAIALISPAEVRGFLWGIGPSVILPTTTRDELSQRKYSLGPAAVGLYLSTDWVIGLFPQYWWSVSGSNKRREVSQANIQYFLWRNLPGGWQIGTSSNILYDRKADGPNAWTVPIGLGFTKTTNLGGLPIKFELQGQAMVIHPDDFGQRWNIRFSITPVIKPLIQRTLF
jgi:hypothetical protein